MLNSTNYLCPTPFLSVTPDASITTLVNQTYQFGATAMLACSSMGGPDNMYQWLFNGSDILGETSVTLTRASVTAATGGEYSCRVSNAAGSNTADSFIFIAPYFVTQPMDIAVMAQSTINLICDVEAFPYPSYQWWRLDGAAIRSGVITTSRNLVFSATFGDEGDYYCVASSLMGQIRSRNVTVTSECLLRMLYMHLHVALLLCVVAPDEVRIIGSNIVARGSDVLFRCSNMGGVDNSYTWLMDNVVLPGETSTSLTLLSVDATHGGNYSCVVTNIAGSSAATVDLFIEPYITEFPMTFLVVERTDSVMFNCRADGFPVPNVTWRRLNAGSDVLAASGEVLMFASATAQDAGTYYCVASTVLSDGFLLPDAVAPQTVLVGMWHYWPL